ncbi:Nramp family divalent metal transporter [Parafilimonas sp.]|uniref:Nramp family divalent metal transporter n=1 Tax=Parafilimonas sp. TaxID=1969739 RepID=UPI0039E5FD5E
MVKSDTHSLNDVHESIDATKQRKGWKKILAFIGPAYLVSVGYMDPGNWATDLQGGAQFGYKLIWVLLMSNLMALLLQSLSARLGIVRRKDLAQVNRETYPPFTNFCLYVLAELAIAACDLAEVLGMALGIQLLTGLPLIWGVSITVLDTFLLFYLQKKGMRTMEAFIIALVLIIGISFLIELFFAKPNMGEMMKGLIPSPLSNQALYIAVGIIGATVMPHNLYLHSALVQTRKINNSEAATRKAIKYNIVDSTVALNAAFLVNAGILILAATAFFYAGHSSVARIQDAYMLLESALGTSLAPILFAVALIASGQSSTVTGTLAGQVVMEGYLHLRINPWMRRLLTRLLAIIPAIIVIGVYGEAEVDNMLVFSQVLLSLQLGFAVIPLIHFVSDKKTMGVFAIRPFVKIIAWLVAIILVFLNVRLVAGEIIDTIKEDGHLFVKIIVIIASLIFAWLFITMTVYPLYSKRKQRPSASIHGVIPQLQHLSVHPFQRIAVALDFKTLDEKLIAHAVKQGNKNATYLLLHVVETVSASFSGNATDDDETRLDAERLQAYATQLMQMGYTVEIQLGYQHRVDEIVRIVKDFNADMLVMGAHRHRGLKDFFYGETVNVVRHKLPIPVLIVS